MTLHHAVITERITFATRLLTDTDLSVDMIASEVGFFDRAQFSTAFKKHIGISPLKYRNINRDREKDANQIQRKAKFS